MNYKTRDIPWVRVVGFHKEIASRAEETFFSLTVDDDNDRWSSLINFNLKTLSGPWIIDIDDIENKILQRSIKQDKCDEIFIGGPCWFKWKKDYGNQYIAKWQPLIYKEIKIKKLENHKYEIIPQQGKWEISPLVYNMLDTKGVVPMKPLDIFIPEILEKSQAIFELENMSLSECIMNVLTNYINEISIDIKREFPKNSKHKKPSEWVLFKAPENFSTFTQNLMSDYNTLDSKLNEHEKDIGGLKLLSDIPQNNTEDTSIDIIPIVPLNKNQNLAVKNILGKNKVTVISGPPGCGKSQVVLSVLLNAWANGSSVLFASNNNQAVDVIKSRLKVFESDFPVAVRAGAKKSSNLEETLRRTINILTNKVYETENIVKLEFEQSKFVNRKYEIDQLINSKIAERIDESIKSAINAYGVYIKNMEILKKNEEKVISNLKYIGFSGSIEKYEEKVVIPLNNWMNQLSECKIKVENNIANKNNCIKERDYIINKRNNFMKEIGLGDFVNEEVLAIDDEENIKKMQLWYEEFKYALNSTIENEFINMDESDEYARWNTVENLTKWRMKVEDILIRIDNCLDIENKDFTMFMDIYKELNEKKDVLSKYELVEVKDLDLEKIKKWLHEYKSFIVMKKNKFEFLPWSHKNRILKLLLEQEKYITSVIPIKNLVNIGQFDEAGRERLSIIVEALYNWKIIYDKWSEKKDFIIKIQEDIHKLKNDIQYLNLKVDSNLYYIEQWKSLKENITDEYNISEKALIVLSKIEKKQKDIKYIMKLSSDFKLIGSDSLIKNKWLSGSGKVFNGLISTLGLNVNKETLIELRSLVYDNIIDNIINNWNELIRYQSKIYYAEEYISNIDSDRYIINKWWNLRPKITIIDNIDLVNILEDDSELKKIAGECNNILNICLDYINNIKPKDSFKSDTEFKWAKSRLDNALGIIENWNERGAISNKLSELIEIDQKWEIDKIIILFEKYNVEKLNAELCILNENIEQVAFNIAKENKIKKLSKDIEAQDALESLLKHYVKNYGKIQKSAYGIFKDALRAMPVWITTAQSPQAIPMEPEIFDLLIIDESTQCTLTNILPLIYRAKKVAVIGDPRQLPAIPTIGGATEEALGEKYRITEWLDNIGHTSNDIYKAAVRSLPRRHSDIISLNEHYRSHPLIIGFSNSKVYQRNLILKKSEMTDNKISKYCGVYGVDVKGECKKGPRNESWINELEAQRVCDVIKNIRKDDNCKKLSIGVITPFKAQVERISQLVENEGIIGITVDTVHKYQGDERDIMIFSTVIASGISEGAIRWVENPPNLINVAVTRAKEALYIVGNLDICKRQTGILGELANYVETIEILRKTSKYELMLYSLMVLRGLEPEVHVVIRDIEVDFVVRNKNKGLKLVIEVDGSQHNNTKSADASRDAFLKASGYRVIRCTTRELEEIPAEVISKILCELEINI